MIEEVQLVGQFIKEFKADKKELKENSFTIVEIGNEIYERRLSRKCLQPMAALVEKLKAEYQKLYGLNEENEEFNPNQSMKISLLNSTFEKICKAVDKIIRTITEFLQDLHRHLVERDVPSKNQRVRARAHKNLMAHFLIQNFRDLDF